MNWYSIVLSFHNIIRWIALILAVIAVVRSLVGLFGKRDWTETDRKIGSFTSITLDIQVILGLILYFALSGITTSALRDFSAAMQNFQQRFFVIEHAFLMLLAVIFAHLGSILSRKALASNAKFKRALIFFSLTLVFLLLGNPWFRPLIPGL